MLTYENPEEIFSKGKEGGEGVLIKEEGDISKKNEL